MVRPERLRKKKYWRRRKDADMFKTVEEVFDEQTLGHIWRLQRKGVLDELKGVVSSGKEARVYWGVSPQGKDLAVKIYLSATAEFRKSIYKYIIGDPRFEQIPRGNFRKLVYEWTRKEYRNLKRMRSAGVRVPEPIAFSGNVLVMEFLGEKGRRAPLLAEAIDELTGEELWEIGLQVAEQLRLIVCEARLVHADLSEYNIMVWEGGPWIIDVSQAVEHSHPMAREFLERDIENITRFFLEHTGRSLESELRGVVECLEQ